MKRRYFFWFTAAFLGGMMLAAKGWLLACGILAAGLLLGALFLHKYAYTKVLLMAMTGVVIGFLCFSGHFAGYRARLVSIEEGRVTVRGRVEQIDESDTLRLLVRRSIQGEDFFYKNTSVYVYPDMENIFTYGDELTLRGSAETPKPPRNFGETNYQYYCMGKGIYAFMYPTEGELQITGNSFSWLRPKDAAYALRTKVQARLSGRTSGEAEGFLRAMLTGDKARMYAEESENLRRAGLSHIVAVSGLHLQIVIGAVMTLFGILKIRRRLFSVACYLLFVWFFVLFTGASPSVLRAALMLSVFFFADFLRRENDSITALAFAAFSLCLVNPGMLFDVGFQLSCASTLGILLFAGKIAERSSFLPRGIRSTAAVSLAAFLGFAPIAAHHFGTVSLVGILANLLVCPLLGFVMITGFLSVLFGNIPYISDGLFWVLDTAVQYILAVAKFCAALPFSDTVMQKPGICMLGAYLLFLVGLYTFTEKRRRRGVWLFCMALVLVAAEFTGVLLLRGTVTVSFLSVGNGDCTLVTAGESTMLFDSGGSPYTDVAESTVMPYLRREGIAEIDAAFLTHYHTDHGEGYRTLLENGFIGTLYLPYHADHDLKPALAALAMEKGVSVRYLGDGDCVRLGALFVAAFDAASGGEENNGLVYRLDALGTRTLFTGDIDKNGERRLVYRGAYLDSDILKVPHHGSDTSGLPEFTDAVSPDIAVICCGENNYGHPKKEILDMYRESGAALYQTDQNGTVRVRLYPGGKKRVETLW